MKLSTIAAAAALATGVSAGPLAKRWFPIKPKVFVFSMFSSENVWTAPLGLTENITVPGLSPLYPNVTCDARGAVCHLTTGEGEINAAVTVASLVASPDFDLAHTYFFIAGIAGVNPFVGTLGSVGFARYAVQVALAYEIDYREVPSNWTTGYWLQGTSAPGQPTTDIYGTEVFELNTNLRDAVVGSFLANVTLNDTATAAAYRANYDYAPANAYPQIFYGDVATSDVYFAGALLAEAFGNITQLWTNNTGVYALTAQEDNASLEALLRGAKAGKLDLSRVILMRTASDLDRAPPNQTSLYSFEVADQGGFTPSIENILIAGLPIVEGILANWDTTYKAGVAPQADWLHNSDDLHTLTELRRRGAERKAMGKRAAAAKRALAA
ncbi:hypothetical protein Q5752_004148 [Cryptotrichosporon argae]